MKLSFDFCICSLLLIALFSSFVECKVRKRGKQNSVSRNRTSNGDNERRTRRSESDASRSTTPSPQIRAQRLVQELLGNYTKVVRPRLNQSQTVNIYFDIRIKQLVNVDVKSSQVSNVTRSGIRNVLSTLHLSLFSGLSSISGVLHLAWGYFYNG